MNADSISFNTKSHTYVSFCKSTKWRTWRRTEVKSNKVLPFVIERKTVNRIRQDILNDKWKRKWYCETFLSQNKTYIMDYSTSGEWWYYHAYDDLTTWHLKSTLQSCYSCCNCWLEKIMLYMHVQKQVYVHLLHYIVYWFTPYLIWNVA